MITIDFKDVDDLNGALDAITSIKGTKDAPNRQRIMAAFNAVRDERGHDYAADQAAAIRAGDAQAAIDALHGIQRNTTRTQAVSWAGRAALDAIRDAYKPLAVGNHDALAAEFNRTAAPFATLKNAGLTADPSTIGTLIAQADAPARKALVDSYKAAERLTELADLIADNYMIADSHPTAEEGFYLTGGEVWTVMLAVLMPVHKLAPTQRRTVWQTWERMGARQNYGFQPAMWRELADLFDTPHADAFDDLKPYKHAQSLGDDGTDPEADPKTMTRD